MNNILALVIIGLSMALLHDIFRQELLNRHLSGNVGGQQCPLKIR